MEAELKYFERRAGEERRAALKAASDKARLSHLELAAAYEKRVTELKGKKGRSALHIVSAA